MKIFFSPSKGAQRPCKLPFQGCDYVTTPGACPACGASEGKPAAFKLQGVPGSMDRGFDRYTSIARCVACEAPIGKVVAVMDTLFGLEEDEAVILHGRARVY